MVDRFQSVAWLPIILASMQENLSLGVCKQKKAQASLHIYAVVILLLESIVSKLASCEFSIFKLVSIAEETGLSLPLSETPKTVLRGPHAILQAHYPLWKT